MLASGSDKRLKYFQERPLSVGATLCRFVDWTLPPKWIISSEKTISPFFVSDFSKIQKRPALFRCWRTVRWWRFFGLRKKAWDQFLQVSSLIFDIFKIKSHFSHGAFGVPPYPLSTLMLLFVWHERSGQSLVLPSSLYTSPQRNLWILVLLAALLSVIWASLRDKVQ